MVYPIALEAVKRLDALFDIERAINGKPAAERRAVRQETQRTFDGRTPHVADRPALDAVAQP